MSVPRSWATAGLLLAAVSYTASAQISITGRSVQPDSIATRYKLDFAVPDAPAFVLLEVDQSTILRPSSIRELSAAVSDFVGSGSGLTIPRAFAVEVSPGLLIGGKSLTLKKYQSAPALYRLRFSAATRRRTDEAGPAEIALGLRVSLIDESDLRTNPGYIDSATAITDELNEIYTNARLRIGPPPAPLVLNEEEQAQVDALTPKLREWWENKKWNARVLEVAAGALGASPDSSGKNLRSQEFATWSTFGIGFGAWGQLLIGGKASTQRDSVNGDFNGSASLSSRFYAGTNRYKFFIELAGKWRQGDDQWLLNAGGEARLIRGAWTSFNAGLETTGGGGTDLVTNLAVKLGVLGL